MSVVGTVESLWRYPVKSMRGEESDELFAGFAGVYGDRLFAFESSASSKGFPFFTGRDQRQMIRYRPRFRDPKKAAQPINRAEAEQSNASPISAKPGEYVIGIRRYPRQEHVHVATVGFPFAAAVRDAVRAFATTLTQL
jgi:uncharacterized protein